MEMLVRRQPTFKDIAFAINGSILPRILRRLLAIMVVSVFAILAAAENPGIFARISAIPFTLIGIALSVFMSFRNSTCYARWWEGRQLWGELVVACRALARETADLAEEHRSYLLRGLCGFTAGLAARLRGAEEIAAIAIWSGSEGLAGSPNPPDALLHRLGKYCLALRQAGDIDSIRYSVLERQFCVLATVQGGCERILTTPVPFSYSLLLHRTALVFCLTLPFALAGSLGWWTVLPVLLVAYTFFGLDALGHQLEEPFSLEPNALPLYALRRTVEREMLALLGETDLPPPLEPRDNVLS
jgi:putative membrane protein